MPSDDGTGARKEHASRDEGGPRPVYIVDEDRLARRATFLLLSHHNYAPHPFGAAQDFLDEILYLQPGCLLLGELDGEAGALVLIEALGDRIAEFPVVVTASHGDVATAVQAMKLGASDVLELPFGRDILPSMLDVVFVKLEQRLGDSQAVRTACSLVEALPAREREVLRCLVKGFSNKQIAHHLDVSLRTIEMHRASMMLRLQVNSLADALRLAFESEFATPPSKGSLQEVRSKRA